MENRPNSKPTLVLMAGFLGTGKTTLAVTLGQALQWPVLEKVGLQLSLLKQDLDTSPEKKGEIPYELLFSMAEDILVRQQLSIILDSSARHPFILDRATQIAYAAYGKLKIILCIAQSSLRKERLSARPELYLFSTNAFETTAIESDLGHFKHLPGDILIIETKDPVETHLPKAVEYLSTEERL